MERIPIKAPLPCYGLEYELADPVCAACPHREGCLKFMGTRATKVTLDRLRFSLLPAKLEASLTEQDPELPHMAVLYANCFQTVFGRKPPTDDNAGFYQQEIIKGALKARCSLRLFILSNMVAQTLHEGALVGHTEKARPKKFNASYLRGGLAVERATRYAKVCKDRYGTFSLSSLSTFSKKDYEHNEMETNMLHSEVTAGQFVVSRKIHFGGEPFSALYAAEEFQLNPYWLAIEPSYKTTVLDPYHQNKRGSDALKNHRFSVFQVLGELKRSKTMQTLAFKARQKIMAEAVVRVLSYYSMRPEDLLHEAVPITDPMALWIQIGRTIQHYHCWLLLEGEPSFFAKQTAKQVNFSS